MMVKKTRVVAAIPAACRLRGLLLSAQVLPPSLPAVAMQAAVNGPERSPGVLLAQAPAATGQAIPAEVQGWADGAAAAYRKGDTTTALRLQKQVVAWLQANRPTQDAFRALALIRLGVLLSSEGQLQEALAPAEESVRIYRELAKTKPADLPDLAASLGNLGTILSKLGRRQEALAPKREAVKIYYSELAKANPSVLPALATSLSNLGNDLRKLGRRHEALASTEEAVKIYRELAKANPSVLPALATSLSNLGKDLSNLGRHQEAQAPTEEALKIRRELANTNPR